jgi:predicted MPP superfamily phosphohydrolase
LKSGIMRSPEITFEERNALAKLAPRVGPLHVARRLALEHHCETQALRGANRFFHIESWYSMHSLIRGSLWLSGLHRRGRRNANTIEVRRHDVPLRDLAPALEGFTILHLSDLHVDVGGPFLDVLANLVCPLEYDVCVLTGDYRARSFGPFAATLSGLERLRYCIKGAAYAVLGNHDTIRLAPGMEAMGYRLLLNESTQLSQGGEGIYLAGIDDAHYYRTEDFQRAGQDIPRGALSILLSHTPGVYRRAAHADYQLMLCGHTHGGQICLPGGVPVLTDTNTRRSLARGSWRHREMIGYTSAGAGTSVVDVRLNCPPEVTLHTLRRGDGATKVEWVAAGTHARG